MSFLKNFKWSFKSILKALGIIVLGVVFLVLIVALLTFAYRSIKGTIEESRLSDADYSYDEFESQDYGGFKEMGVASSMAPEASPVMPLPPTKPPFGAGDDAEDFEVVGYDASIKAKDLSNVCLEIEKLKQKAHVIFEESNRDGFHCYYRFKVEKKLANDVLQVIEELDPDNLNTSITSIKKSVEGVQSEIDILTKKLEGIEEALNNAQASYDEISQLATKQQDAETLARIIDSKLNLIERLTNERLNIKSQIDYYNKSQADLLDQLEYTFFTVSVEKDVIWDGEQIKESWKEESRRLVQDLNFALQMGTLGLITYLVYVAFGIIYLLILVFTLKFVWKVIRHIWVSEKPFHKAK